MGGSAEVIVVGGIGGIGYKEANISIVVVTIILYIGGILSAIVVLLPLPRDGEKIDFF